MIMKKHGVAALLEANHHNIRYLTALHGFIYPMCRYVLFFAEHDPVMYEHDGYFHQMPDQCPWIKEWRPAHSWLSGAPGPGACADEAKVFAVEIKAELEERGLLGEKLALGSFDGNAREALVNAGVKNIVDSRNLMLEARMIKNQDEINCLKTCASMVDGVGVKWSMALSLLTVLKVIVNDAAQIQRQVGNQMHRREHLAHR